MKKVLSTFIIILFILFAIGCNRQPQTAKQNLPNIIFILADDLGWGDLQCFGNDLHETPNLDGLASEGMRFINAYAACPVCSPTRASILTGKYPVSVNITDWIPGRQSIGARDDEMLIGPDFFNELKHEEITIAERLKELGYTCASIGKWHLGDTAYFPTTQGFDINAGGNKYGSPATYFWPFRKEGRDRSIPDMEKKGKEGEYLDDLLSDQAIDFIIMQKDGPFFLYLPFYLVHIPLEAKQELIARYQRKIDTTPGLLHTNPVYASMVEIMDKNIGRVLFTLDSLQISDNTIVFFMSDNGGLSVLEGPHTPATTNYPLREGKGHLYEGGIREPLIVRWPGVIESGTVCEKTVSSIDFYPTIMDAVGLKPGPVDGVSFLPLLKQTGEPAERALFWHYPHYSNQGGKPGSAIRAGDYKLIEFFEDGSLELYNLKEDISETNNLMDSQPGKAKELYEILVKWREEKNARLPVPNPGYKGK